jgi:hypothetical protein
MLDEALLGHWIVADFPASIAKPGASAMALSERIGGLSDIDLRTGW